MENAQFIADVHLGKLARALRLLGFDTLYSNTFTAAQLTAIAAAQNRTLLSRSAAFSKNQRVRSLVLKSETPEAQVQQVVQEMQLRQQLCPFSRCLMCNGLLAPVSKEAVSIHLEQNTATYVNAFWQCTLCRRVYWKGSHYNRMLQLVERIKQQES